MLNKYNLLSVNQLAAQIKLLEVWKSVNLEGYPIMLEPYNNNLSQSGHSLRPQGDRIFKDMSKLHKAESSFNIDAARIWNAAPKTVTSAITLSLAKKSILLFVKSLPV